MKDRETEPIEAPRFDVDAWRAKLDTYLDVDFPDIEEDAPLAVEQPEASEAR